LADTASRLEQLIAASPTQNAAKPSETKIPEHPKLAEGIELLGEMKESAFIDAPWLASRNGKFLQITELLHRVAENATGDKTIDEMAASISRDYERSIANTGRDH
jgi:hypothetical protein